MEARYQGIYGEHGVAGGKEEYWHHTYQLEKCDNELRNRCEKLEEIVELRHGV